MPSSTQMLKSTAFECRNTPRNKCAIVGGDCYCYKKIVKQVWTAVLILD